MITTRKDLIWLELLNNSLKKWKTKQKLTNPKEDETFQDDVYSKITANALVDCIAWSFSKNVINSIAHTNQDNSSDSEPSNRFQVVHDRSFEIGPGVKIRILNRIKRIKVLTDRIKTPTSTYIWPKNLPMKIASRLFPLNLMQDLPTFLKIKSAFADIRRLFPPLEYCVTIIINASFPRIYAS